MALDKGFVDYFIEVLEQNPDMKQTILRDLQSSGLDGLGGCAYLHETQCSIYLKRHVDFTPEHIPELETALREHYEGELVAITE